MDDPGDADRGVLTAASGRAAHGGIVTITVTGKTGTIGNDRVLSFTPASYLA